MGFKSRLLRLSLGFRTGSGRRYMNTKVNMAKTLSKRQSLFDKRAEIRARELKTENGEMRKSQAELGVVIVDGFCCSCLKAPTLEAV